MRRLPITLLALTVCIVTAQTPTAPGEPQGARGGPPPVPRKHLLVIGMTRDTNPQYGVFWSSLGHTNDPWDHPDVQEMYLEAVKWTMRRIEGGTASHRKVNGSPIEKGLHAKPA